MVGEQSVSMLCGDPGRHRNTFFSLGRRISFFTPSLGCFACSSCAKPDYSNRSLCFSFFPNGGQLSVLRRNFQTSQILYHQVKKLPEGTQDKPGLQCAVCDLQPFARSARTDLVCKYVAAKRMKSWWSFLLAEISKLETARFTPRAYLSTRTTPFLLGHCQTSSKSCSGPAQLLPGWYPLVCVVSLWSTACRGTGQCCASLAMGVKCEPASKLS